MFSGQKRAYSCVVLLVGLWCGGTAYAEPLQDHLTVSDVLMLAAESDARMGEADQLAIAAQHAITRETKGERPYFRFVASAEAIEDSDPFRREGELYSAKLEAGQTVYSFGRAGATRAAAQAGYDRFAAARSLTEQDIMLEAAQKAIAVMAVDNLPNELPRDASQGFSENFVTYVIPAFFNSDKDGILQRARMTQNGKLTPRYQYLDGYVKGLE